MGVLVVTYTIYGGIAAVTWTDVQQMVIMIVGPVVALFMAIVLCRPTFRSSMRYSWRARPAG